MPMYLWKSTSDGERQVSVVRRVADIDVSPDRECPECGSLAIGVGQSPGSDKLTGWCTECSCVGWTVRTDWERVMCAPSTRWYFND